MPPQSPPKGEGGGLNDDIDPELKKTFDKLGIPLEDAARAEQDGGRCRDGFGVGQDHFEERRWPKRGIVFCSMSEAIRDYPG